MTDLLSLIEQDTALRRVASTGGGEYAGPCPFCGGTDRFRVWPDHPDGPRWRCMGTKAGRNGCGRGGDAIAYLVERGDLTKAEAYKARHSGDVTMPTGMTRTRKSVDTAPVRHQTNSPPRAWQEQARLFVGYCQEQLHPDVGREALDYLHERGLRDETIRRWGLGWHANDRWCDPERWGLDGGKMVWLARGVVIPWLVEGATWHVKVRRFDGKPKYVRVRGGQPTLFGLDFVTGKRVVVICEGELDAVLLWQEAGDLVDVVAVGSKGAKIPLPFLAHLAGAARWLVALDNDADDKANEWGAYSARVRRVRPLHGNDLTDFYQAGGDLRAWVTFHRERLDAQIALNFDN